MFSIMQFLLFGVLKIGKTPDHDMIRIVFALAQASMPLFHFLSQGVGLWAACLPSRQSDFTLPNSTVYVHVEMTLPGAKR